MTDIHSHILPFIDDGSSKLEDSVSMIAEAKKQGVDKIVCTPHFRYGSFENKKEDIEKVFSALKNESKDLGVELYLGEEIRYSKAYLDDLKKGKYLTVNQSKYVLTEFDFVREISICEAVDSIVFAGYKPIVAHYERYNYSSLDEALEIKKAGAFIQVNADSLFGKCGKKAKKLAFDLIKNELADCIAGDIHANRKYVMEKAAKLVSKKFGESAKNYLFVYFPNKAINNG